MLSCFSPFQLGIREPRKVNKPTVRPRGIRNNNGKERLIRKYGIALLPKKGKKLSN
jgi:hypothetical protein